ncbi:hypothetical protein AB0L42_29165 [Streptomyces sp. NPDC052287]|uniref:hypothetical protein n=1 Tax=Streptomyces sp. NPDC052287 TaxID=3154950 RepID=UPI00343317F5
MTTGKKLRQLAMGSRLALNGVEWTVESIEPQFGRLRLAHEDGRVDERLIRWLVHHPDVRPLGARQPEQRQQSAGQMRSQEDLTDIQLQRAMIRAEHVREAATGFRDGHPSRARPREPRSAYDPDRTTFSGGRQRSTSSARFPCTRRSCSGWRAWACARCRA